MGRPFIFIQARMGSSRLPGKVLKPIAGKPQLERLVERLGSFTARGQVTVLTTVEPSDDTLAQYCKDNELSCFRGSESDVLDRYYQAAVAAGVNENDVIVRVTADCPLHHKDVIKFALREFEIHRLDYFSNSFAPHFEDGCDTEVFSLHTLETAHRKAKLASQREHVTPFIKDSGLFTCGYRKYNPNYKFKLSVDTIEDHTVVENIFNAFGDNSEFTIHEVVELVQRRPELIAANRSSVINAGYTKSLENDKEMQ